MFAHFLDHSVEFIPLLGHRSISVASGLLSLHYFVPSSFDNLTPDLSPSAQRRACAIVSGRRKEVFLVSRLPFYVIYHHHCFKPPLSKSWLSVFSLFYIALAFIHFRFVMDLNSYDEEKLARHLPMSVVLLAPRTDGNPASLITPVICLCPLYCSSYRRTDGWTET